MVKSKESKEKVEQYLTNITDILQEDFVESSPTDKERGIERLRSMLAENAPQLGGYYVALGMYVLGSCYMRAGKNESAIDTFMRTVAMRPDYMAAQRALKRVLLMERNRIRVA